MSSTDMLSAGSVHEGSSEEEQNSFQSKHDPLPEEVQDEIDQLGLDVPVIDDYFTILNKVGSGTFSSVYLAKLKAEHSVGTDKLALKHILPTSHPTRIENELRCLHELGGKDNIMGVNACLRFRDHVVIVMPYFQHDKFPDYVGELTVREVQDYMKNLLTALRRVHQAGIIHRDVKPSNFLFNRKLNKYSLVDFGLAQKVPTKFTSPSCTPNMVKDANVVHKDAKFSRPMGQPPRLSIAKQFQSKCRLKEGESSGRSADKRAFGEIDQNIQGPESKKPKLEVKKSETSCRSTMFTPGQSPRRTLLTRKVEMQTSALKHMNTSTCQCHGQPTVCSICLARSQQVAPRAGTPGFRSPEVLLKCPNQTTAVDMWSAGVIMLSMLTGRYPFFKANDDMTALAQIISLFGSEEFKIAGKMMGKDILISQAVPAVDLKTMCERLRQVQRRTSPRKGQSPYVSSSHNQWHEVPDNAISLLGRLLDINPETRMTAEEALKHSFITGNMD